MSHAHYCDVAGHEWLCRSVDCLCICQIRLEDGDHSQCPVELRACPEHLSHSVSEPLDERGRIEVPANIGDMLARWASSSESNIGWCLLCDSPIRDEDDLLPGTHTHDCETGRVLDARNLSR